MMNKTVKIRWAVLSILACCSALAFNPPASPTDPNERADDSEKSNCNTSGPGGARNGCLSLRIPFGRLAHAPELSKGFLGLDYERASPQMHTPQGLAYRLYAFSSVTKAAGDDVTVEQANGDGVTFRFPYRSSVAEPVKRETGFPNRLRRLDAEGVPVTNAAAQTVAWYDHWYSDGSRVRLSAQTGKSVSVTTAEGRVVKPETCGVTVVRDAEGVLQQVWSEADGLADIVVTAPGSAYEIRLYAPEVAGPTNASGLRAVSGDPVTVWHISNPDAAEGTWSRLVAVEDRRVFAVTNEWRYIQSRDEWVLDQSSPGRRILHDSEKSADGKSRTLTEMTYCADGKTVARKRATRSVDYGWGLAERESVEDPSGACLTRTVEYYRDPSQTGSYTQPKIITYPDGAWESFDYDAQGRLTLRVTPWLGQPVSPSGKTAAQLAETGLAVSYSYAPVAAADVPGIVDTRPRTSETRVAGGLTACSYASYVREDDGSLTVTRETCTEFPAAFGAASNLRAIVTHYPTNEVDSARVKTVLSPDGVMRTFSYAAGDWSGSLADQGNAVFTPGAYGSALNTTVTEGTQAAPGGVPGKTRATVIYADKRGNPVLTKILARSEADFINIAWTAAAYDAFHNVTSRLDSAGYASSASWAGRDLPVAAADDFGLSYAYGYDALGRVACQVRLPAGGSPAVTNAFVYDALDRVTEASVASGGFTRRLLAASYDRAGRPESVTDAQGRTAAFVYADGGRTVTETLPGGGTLVGSFWPGGAPRSVTGAAAAPPVWYSYGLENGKFWTRAAAGSENSPATVTRYADPAGRTVSVRHADGLSESLAYDLAGRLTNALDRAGRATRFNWDGVGNPLSVERQADAGFAAVSFGLDLAALTESVTNEAGALISLSVSDVPGRKVTDTGIDGLPEVTRFAAGGRVDSVSRRDGVLVSNVWDAAGRLAEVRHAGTPVLGIAWRADGLPLSTSNAEASVSWTYDALGRAVTETSRAGAGAPEACLALALGGAALPTNAAVTVSGTAHRVSGSAAYDAAERLSSRSGPAGTFGIAYGAADGLPESVTNAALSGYCAYDLVGRLTNTVFRNAVGTAVGSFRYRYDASGFVTQKVSAVGQASLPVTNSYAYDALGRLRSDGSTSYTYDAAGNRLTAGASNFTYSNNRLNGVLHDNAGNITNMVRGGVTLGLSWNTLGQLTTVSTNGAFAESYTYDPLGRRVSTTDGSDIVWHAYDGDQCVADLDASGNPLRSYTWGPGVDNLLALTVYGTGSTNSYYAVKDHLGSVQALVNASGAVMESYTYDAWGNTAILSSGLSPLTSSAYGNRFMFQGREYSVATGLYNFRARWYAPDLGRWLSPDPIGLEGGLNLYEFCKNDSVNNRDPTGLVTYYVHEGQKHAYIVISDPRSSTGYTQYDYGPDTGGWESINSMFEAATSPAVWTRWPDVNISTLPEDSLALNTTEQEECAIRNEGDRRTRIPRSDAYMYHLLFNNCAYGTRDLLYSSGYLTSPNARGWIYTPTGLAEELEGRVARRNFAYGIRRIMNNEY